MISRSRSANAYVSGSPENNIGNGKSPRGNGTFGVLVSAITLYNERVLLLRRSFEEKFLPGVWGVPAGKIQYGEEPDDAALRELYEEAGIKGEVERNAGSIWFESQYKDRDVQHIQLNYIVRADNARVELMDGSNMDYRWVSIYDMDDPPVPIDDFTLRVIRQALDKCPSE